MQHAQTIKKRLRQIFGKNKDSRKPCGLRQNSGLPPSAATNSFRFTHSTNTTLQPFIIDVYDGVAIVQAHSRGMHNDRKRIAEAPSSVLGKELIPQLVFYKATTAPGKCATPGHGSILKGRRQRNFLKTASLF